MEPKTEHASARVGTWLRDKWRLDALLGLGGMAAVYSATHRNGKRAAVKMLHPQSAADAVVKARFLREGYLANQVGHPGAVSILDDDVTEDGEVYLVMELLEGDTLEQLRLENGGTMAIGDVLTIADQTLDVLVAAHDRKIIHRDIKPANLFVTLGGTLKVLDFGIARLDDAATPRTATATFTTAMGTIGFMAPEQARGRWEIVDARTDLWSLGATMFELLAGRLVHQAPTANEMFLAAMTQAAPPIASCVPDIPHPAAEIIDRALAYEREARWSDARAMQLEIRRVYRDLTGRSLPPLPTLAGRLRRSGPPPSPDAPTLPAVSAPAPEATTARRERAVPRLSKRKGAAGVALVGLGLIAAFGGITVLRRGPTPSEASVVRPVSLSAPVENGARTTKSEPPLPAAAAAAPQEIEGVPLTPASSSVTSPSTAPAAPVPPTISVSPAVPPVAPNASARAASTVRVGSPRAPSSTADAPPPSATVDLFGRRK